MAALEDIRAEVFSNTELKNRVTAQTLTSAFKLVFPPATPSAEEKSYFVKVIRSPILYGEMMFFAVIGSNTGASVEAILGSSDGLIAGSVDAITPILVDALAGV